MLDLYVITRLPFCVDRLKGLNCHCYFCSQNEELEVLQSIYGEEWVCINEETREYRMTISDETHAESIILEVSEE